MKKQNSHQKLLIHIGYHKTGSTYLQEDWFADENLPFIGPWSRETLLIDFIKASPFEFEPQKMQNKYGDMINELYELGKTTVLSYEDFSGCPGSGGYNSAEIAKRLFSVFPDAKILIFIRKQQDVLLSYYKQYIRDGGASTLQEFLHPPQEGIVRVPFFRPDFYEFHHLINFYQNLFSPHQVLVIPYEKLRQDPQVVFEDVLKFTGHNPASYRFSASSNVNLSQTEAQTVELKKLNLLHYRSQFNPNPVQPVAADIYNKDLRNILLDRNKGQHENAKIKKEWEGLIEEYCDGKYTDSNRVVVKLTGLDLSSYGYDL